jgi:hypothetical protein
LRALKIDFKRIISRKIPNVIRTGKKETKEDGKRKYINLQRM